MSSKSQELLAKIEKADDLVPCSSIWQHYKGGIYVVMDHVILTDTGDIGVKYRRIDGPDYDYHSEDHIYYVRPISEWFDKVEIQNQEIGSVTERFIEVRKVSLWAPV
jgi:hypothetical protein